MKRGDFAKIELATLKTVNYGMKPKDLKTALEITST